MIKKSEMPEGARDEDEEDDDEGRLAEDDPHRALVRIFEKKISIAQQNVV